MSPNGCSCLKRFTFLERPAPLPHAENLIKKHPFAVLSIAMTPLWFVIAMVGTLAFCQVFAGIGSVGAISMMSLGWSFALLLVAIALKSTCCPQKPKINERPIEEAPPSPEGIPRVSLHTTLANKNMPGIQTILDAIANHFKNKEVEANTFVAFSELTRDYIYGKDAQGNIFRFEPEMGFFPNSPTPENIQKCFNVKPDISQMKRLPNETFVAWIDEIEGDAHVEDFNLDDTLSSSEEDSDD